MSLLTKLKRGVSLGVGLLLLLGGTIGLLYLSYRLAGLVATIVYAILFLVSATLIPVMVFLKVPSMYGPFKKLFGKTHFVLGQVAYGIGVLVQGRREWSLHAGRKRDGEYQAHVDGEWRDIDGGENVSILGWKPFIIVNEKTEDTWQDVRVEDDFAQDGDEAAPSMDEIARADLQTLAQDGGQTQPVNEGVERGGFTEKPVTPGDVPKESWLLDLKQIYTRGLERVGDIALVEKMEEITMRNNAKSGLTSGWEVQIGLAVGLFIGVATGYVMTMGG